MSIELINKDVEIKKAQRVFRALNHPVRKKIIEILDEKQKANVTDVIVQLRLEQSVVSQHLKILREAKIVVAERHGKFIYYKPNYDRLSTLGQVTAIINNYGSR